MISSLWLVWEGHGTQQFSHGEAFRMLTVAVHVPETQVQANRLDLSKSKIWVSSTWADCGVRFLEVQFPPFGKAMAKMWACPCWGNSCLGFSKRETDHFFGVPEFLAGAQ